MSSAFSFVDSYFANIYTVDIWQMTWLVYMRTDHSFIQIRYVAIIFSNNEISSRRYVFDVFENGVEIASSEDNVSTD